MFKIVFNGEELILLALFILLFIIVYGVVFIIALIETIKEFLNSKHCKKNGGGK